MTADPADIIGIYRRRGLKYDARRSRSLAEQPWLDRFLEIAGSGEILDLGCGAGEPMAAYLLKQGNHVTGVDPAEESIKLAEERFPDAHWVYGDMRGLDLGRRFAGILAWDSFFHLDHEDQRAMFDVFARHAAPGAALMFTSGTGHGVAFGEMFGEPLYHASLAPEEYKRLLANAGFEVVDHKVEDPDCGGHTIWLAAYSDPPQPPSG